MKQRILIFLTACAVCISFSGCSGSEAKTEPVSTASSASSAAVPAGIDGSLSSDAGSIDVDLTALSSTMVYSEVYNMMAAPADYIGKTVKMKGQFAVYHDETTGKNYFAVVIADATACCQQGLEFVLKNDAVYPDDYPQIQTEITVQGIFETYMEGEYQYCHLINAEIVP